MAADTFQIKRGSTAQVAAYLPAVAEPVYDITLKRLHIGDGVTLGGTEIAPLVSPPFTGVPTGPTAAPGTNTTQLATTAFADAIRVAIANGADPTKGAALVGFRGRTVASKLLDELNARDYNGATGGVGVDETVRLQAGIDATPVGGCFFIPAGDWEYTKLTVSKAMIIRGAGGSSTNLRCTAATGGGIEFTNAPTVLYRVGIKDVSISSTVDATSGAALRFGTVGHGLIENVYIAGFLPSTRPFDGLVLNNTSQFSIHNLQINDCVRHGVTIEDHSVDIYVTNSRSDANTGNGWLVRGSEGLYFSNVSAYSNTTNNWYLANHATFDNKHLFFNNCIGDSSGLANWLIEDLRNSFFSNCWAVTQKSAANTFVSGFMCVKAVGGNLDRICFSNCIANNNNRHGWTLEGGEYISLVNCLAEGNGAASTGSGINVNTTLSSSITMARMISNTGQGLTIGAGCTNFSVTDSQAYNNTSGPYASSTAGVVVRNFIGFKTTNTGTGVITAASTSVVVTHGLAITPSASSITVTPTNNTTADYGNIWVSGITSTQFTVNVRVAPGASTMTFNWFVADL